MNRNTGPVLVLSGPQLVPKVMRAGKGTEVNNYASLICGRHHRGTKIGPKETRTSPSKFVPKLVPLRDMGPCATSCRGDLESQFGSTAARATTADPISDNLVDRLARFDLI
jgi:hypothetical protein